MIKDPQNYPYKLIKQKIMAANPIPKSIGALAYGTGARVSELNLITKHDIIEKEGYLQITCHVLKKRNPTTENSSRVALIRLDEDWLVQPIRSLMEGKQDSDVLVPMYRMKIYRILVKEFGINPHGFRKIRATHLAQMGFTAHQLKHFFGWASVAPSDYYVRLNTEDLRY